MPHVVIEGQARISDYQQLFRSIDFRQGTRIIKIQLFVVTSAATETKIFPIKCQRRMRGYRSNVLSVTGLSC